MKINKIKKIAEDMYGGTCKNCGWRKGIHYIELKHFKKCPECGENVSFEHLTTESWTLITLMEKE